METEIKQSSFYNLLFYQTILSNYAQVKSAMETEIKQSSFYNLFSS